MCISGGGGGARGGDGRSGGRGGGQGGARLRGGVRVELVVAWQVFVEVNEDGLGHLATRVKVRQTRSAMRERAIPRCAQEQQTQRVAPPLSEAAMLAFRLRALRVSNRAQVAQVIAGKERRKRARTKLR